MGCLSESSPLAVLKMKPGIARPPITVIADILGDRAFRDGVSSGYVHVTDLLDSNFHGREWVYDPYWAFSLRVDRVTLPQNLFQAELKRRSSKWGVDNNVQAIPAKVQKSIRESLEVRAAIKSVLLF